jgi:hypothetical protein
MNNNFLAWIKFRHGGSLKNLHAHPLNRGFHSAGELGRIEDFERLCQHFNRTRRQVWIHHPLRPELHPPFAADDKFVAQFFGDCGTGARILVHRDLNQA